MGRLLSVGVSSALFPNRMCAVHMPVFWFL